MSIESIRPANLVNIKRLANQLKKAEDITHKSALHSAARRAGFENYEHARKSLGNSLTAQNQSHKIFLTAYWTDRETFKIGRETLEIKLVVPLQILCTRAEMKLVGGLCNLRVASADHLVMDGLRPSQSYAQDELCKAARALQFMEATGLRPCPYEEAQKAIANLNGQLPKKDHPSDWHDPVSGQFILIDEPYSKAIVCPERAKWAKENNWFLKAAIWPGLYFPYRCAFFVASEKSDSFDFDALMETINAMPDPVTAERWPGETAENHETFLSPLAKTHQDKRRAKAKGTIVPRNSKKTIPYTRSLIGAARKPNGQMSLEEHRMAGRMIRAVLQSNFKPHAVNRRMDKLMSTLVDWLYEDVPHRELNRLYDPVDIYYGEMPSDDAFFLSTNSSKGVVDILTKLKRLLEHSYPDSKPLRQLTGRVETALKLTAALKS